MRRGEADIVNGSVSPVRLVVRHVAALLLARGTRWGPLMPAERLAGLVIETALGAGIAYLPYRGVDRRWFGIASAADQARTLSVLSVARSMDLPYATIARRVAELVAAGYLHKDKGGIRVAPHFVTDARLHAAMVQDRADLARILAMLAEAGYRPAPSLLESRFTHVPDDVVGRALLAFALRVLETFTQLYGDATNGTLAAAITAANVHHVTQDPVLARRFSDEHSPPPDALRRPISVRDLARRMDMPFETVRRRVNTLRALGIVEVLAEGLIVPSHVLMGRAHRANNRRILQHFEQMLEQLCDLAETAGGS